ncbi:hypothetical protein EDB84DRAFT_1568343 [Lactarius hengduanensis]|nr:hypothetical protein EDB84DRAFT_1568343 [Lactarius hengduanensis]
MEKILLDPDPARSFLHDAIWVNNAFSQPRPCHCVNLLVGLILAFYPSIQVVAVGTGKQHDGDLCYWSRRRPRHAGVSQERRPTEPARKSTDGDVEMRVVANVRGQPPPAPAGASRRSSSSQFRVSLRRMSKMPLFLPPPSESTSSEPPPHHCDRDRDHDTLDIISIDASSSSRSPPPRRSPRKTKM